MMVEPVAGVRLGRVGPLAHRHASDSRARHLPHPAFAALPAAPPLAMQRVMLPRCRTAATTVRWGFATRGRRDVGDRGGSGSAPVSTATWRRLFVVDDAVKAALRAKAPVVALESTIITHGMPYPANVATAREVEAIVRQHGATPATIAIMDGRIHVGLHDAALERLGAAPQRDVSKCSTRDIPHVVAAGGMGSTTVAGTMTIASWAGIRTFVTGGIGGVHRGVASTWDISADLTELGRTPVAVVCAGVKSILDIDKTLEYLETQCVPVITLAPPTDPFPAFFSVDSGCRSPHYADTVAAIARVIATARALDMKHGHVIAVPNPDPAQHASITTAIQTALQEAARAGVSGRDTTPFLLKRVNELTGGDSLRANVALIKNNARVGAQLAVELHSLGNTAPATTPTPFHTTRTMKPAAAGAGAASLYDSVALATMPMPLAMTHAPSPPPPATGEGGASPSSLPSSAGGMTAPRARGKGVRAGAGRTTPTSHGLRHCSTGSTPSTMNAAERGVVGRPLVIGGAVVDTICRPAVGTRLIMETSNPGTVSASMGGVGRNVAEALTRLGGRAVLVTAVGEDAAGNALKAGMASTVPQCTMVTPVAGGGIQSDQSATAQYVAMLDEEGDLVAAVADMAVFDAALRPGRLTRLRHATGDSHAPGAGDHADAPCIDLDRVLRWAPPPFIVMDGNVPTATLSHIAAMASERGTPVLFEATSVHKCAKLVEAGAVHRVAAIKPNRLEVLELAKRIRRVLGLSTHDLEGGQPSTGSNGSPPANQAAHPTTTHATPPSHPPTVGDDLTLGSFTPSSPASPAPAPPVVTVRQRAVMNSASGVTQDAVSISAAPAHVVGGDGGSTHPFTRLTPAQQAHFLHVLNDTLPFGRATTDVAGDASGEGGEDGQDEAEEEDVPVEVEGLDPVTLTAAQTVLAAMIRPSGVAGPVSPIAAARLMGDEDVLVDADAVEAGDKVQPTATSVLEGRKHVFVTLGKHGVLWLSAPPAPTDAIADRLLSLPFFIASYAPDIDMDFNLCPAPTATLVKCTGAGDTWVGALVARVVTGHRVADAVAYALAAAKVAVETDVGGHHATMGSTISASLTPAAVEAVLPQVQAVDPSY